MDGNWGFYSREMTWIYKEMFFLQNRVLTWRGDDASCLRGNTNSIAYIYNGFPIWNFKFMLSLW